MNELLKCKHTYLWLLVQDSPAWVSCVFFLCLPNTTDCFYSVLSLSLSVCLLWIGTIFLPLRSQAFIWIHYFRNVKTRKQEKKNPPFQKFINTPPITSTSVDITLAALHGICHPFLLIYHPAGWVRQWMPIVSSLFDHERARTWWEETTFICSRRTKAEESQVR